MCRLYCPQGRNDFAIFVITRKLGILTWDEAFLCLRSNLLSESFRAKYCELIIGKSMFTVIKEGLYIYRIWCGVNRLGDSGVTQRYFSVC